MDKPTIQIKRATVADLNMLAMLFNEYRIFYKQPGDMEGAKDFIRERMEKEESVIFIATTSHSKEQNGAGFTQLYPFFTSVGLARKWVLNDLYVHPGSRRLGIARKLMLTAIDFARSTGAKGLSLETAIDNIEAQPLYEDLGFKKDEAYYHYDLSL